MKDFLKLSVIIFIGLIVIVVGVSLAFFPLVLAEHYSNNYYIFLLLLTVPISMSGLILFFVNSYKIFDLWD